MEEWTLVPPDGGWGWLVLFGSTLVNVLVPGTIKSFGVLFLEFSEAFHASPSTAAWIPALCYFLYSSLGPVSSILSLKYSYKIVTFIGGTSAAVGMILSFFAQSIVHLYLSYGVLVGLGAGLAFPPTVYIVTSYFVKRRGIANGICISGSSFGSIILPPLLRFFLETYGYRGAVLLMGGITFHCWIAALFYDPVEKHMKRVPKNPTKGEDRKVNIFTEKKPKFMISTDDSSSSECQSDENDPFLENTEYSSNTFVRSASSTAISNYKGSSGHECNRVASTVQKQLLRVQSGGNSHQLTGTTTLHSIPKTPNAMDMYSQHILPKSKKTKSTTAAHGSPSNSSFQYISTPYHGSSLTLSVEAIASTFSIKTDTYAEKHPPKQDQPVKKTKLFDVSILKDPLYLVILISNSTNAISYTNFIILLPSYAHTLGFDKNKGALLLSIVSAFDLVGRFGGSTLSDITFFQKQWYFILGLLFSGISLAVLPFAPTYATLSILCASFGLASGVYVGITAVIMADLLGLDKIQSSYGISLFVNGVIQLIGPPLCGLWFQSINTYVPIFCTLGVVLVIGASMWGIVPFINKKSDSTDKDLYAIESS